MKVEIRANGATHIHLTPETAIEKLAAAELADAAAKGQRVTLTPGENGALILGVER